MRLGIEAIADRLCTEISGGQRQLASIAKAVVQDPELIVFDEPTAALSLRLHPAASERLWDATDDDVLALIDLVADRVFQVHGVRLEPEVIVIGEDAPGS